MRKPKNCVLAQADTAMKEHALTDSVINQVNRQSGVTLIELVITIVVVGIAMSALISSLSTGIANSASPLWEGKALELSQAYLDEIIAMKYDENTPSGGSDLANASVSCTAAGFNDGESRALFDDVDDYHNLSDSPPVLIDSTIDMSEYANYSVDVQVACAGTEVGLNNDESAKRIRVTVTVPGGESRSVAIYKGNF